MAMMNDDVLMDVDGVIFDYPFSFDEWVKYKYGFTETAMHGTDYEFTTWYNESFDMMKEIQNFNETIFAANLRPHRDVIESMIQAKADYHVSFTLVTKFGLNPVMKAGRMANLKKHLPDGLVDDVIFVPLNESKKQYLRPWENSGVLFIEDYYKNALDAIEMGIDAHLIKRPYTHDLAAKYNIPLIETGYQLYDKIAEYHG